VLADSPLIYYRLGDPSGSTTVADSSGNGHNGAAIGGVTFGQPGALAGDPDTSASFDGSTGIVDSGTQVLSPSSTIEAWIHPTSSQCSGSGCSAGQSAIAGTGGSFQLTWGRDPSHVIVWLWPQDNSGWLTLEAPDAIPLDTWTYLATTWNGVTDQLSIYINGALDATVNLPGVISSKQQGGRSYNFAAGGFTSGEQPFQGGIDEVAYYGSALTPDRILAHYRAGSTAAVAPAVTGVSPGSGPVSGGTSVTITGSGLTGATGVSFGGTAASSFTVNGDTSITATAPAATAAGPVDVTVTTPSGTSATSSADQYTYTYPFAGYQAPVDNPPTVNQVNAGQAIPMQFSLGGSYGLNIIAPGYPTATQISCATGAPVNTGTLTDTAGGSGLQYDSATGTYTYVWKTSKSWARTCQQFDLRLNDGTDHTADFQFK
jgi:hypothetical protein